MLMTDTDTTVPAPLPKRRYYFDVAICLANLMHEARCLFSSLKIEFTVIESFLACFILPFSRLEIAANTS